MASARSFVPLTDDPLWYKDAIIYEVPVKAFCDSNADGIGDFPGLTQKLDYIQDLGVNAVWLLPFYPSPMRDDGYDIADYHNVAAEYGVRADFRNFVREAHRRGLRVITELVINHTSDQHPWFQAARRAPPGSAKRDYYVWSETHKRYEGTRVIFTDTETSNWAWDALAGAYYWHRFFSHQPDLNFNNPRVVKAVMRVMQFWLDLGVDGMRLDAIPYLCEREGTNNENLPETHAVIKYMRAELDARYRNRMFLAEANQWPEDVREYFGDGDECHMAYHFPLMPRIYMAVAQEDRYPIVEIMKQTPDIPDNCHWAIFLRNHDELTLEMVTDRERDYMYRTYAADMRARINLGIRRRLAPLMENNRAKIELMTWLLMTMPGAPILYYGDEIGMGDNIYLGDRNGVRTPMQWTPDRNAGFSRADPQRLYLPPLMDPIYGYESVNVESQARNPSSLLNWTKRVIGVRKSLHALSRGTLTFLNPGNRKILAYTRALGDEATLCVANLCRSPQAVELDLAAWRGRVLVELTGRNAFPPVGEAPYLMTVPGYGFYAFQLSTDIEVPRWHQEMVPRLELPVLVLLEGWNTFRRPAGPESGVRHAMALRTRLQLQREVLAPYLLTKRWFAGKGHAIRRVEIVDDGEWRYGDDSWLLAFVGVECEDMGPQTYFLPLAVAWRDDEELARALAPWIVARVRQKSSVGILYSAFGDDAFCRGVLSAMGRNDDFALSGGTLRFWSTAAYPQLAHDLAAPISRPTLEQTNTSLIIGDQLYLKAYRRIEEGLNAEAEMGRFLTEVAEFPNIAPVAGGVDYVRGDGTQVSLMLLQGYRENQGNGWDYTLDYLERFFETCLAENASDAAREPDTERHGMYLGLMRTLGRRTAQLHRALSLAIGNPAFEPEVAGAGDVGAWVRRVEEDATRTLEGLEKHRAALDPALAEPVAHLLAARARLLDRIASARPGEGVAIVKTRYHGDYHLGQVLLYENDFVITDFEGEPARPLADRRAKHSPLRDVAGMLRSFGYAAEAALDQFCVTRPNDRPALSPRARAWERAARGEFLAAYRETVAGCPAYPASDADAARLIELFAIEKTLYEVRYEQDNRPAWLGIPLRGLLRLIFEENLP